jgi:hypothetical protein
MSKLVGWMALMMMMMMMMMGCNTVAFGWYYSAFFGIIANLVLYFVQVWGLSNSDAANAVTTLSGTAFVFSFAGAFASDAYLGRLWTSIIFQALSLTVYIYTMYLHSAHARWMDRSGDWRDSLGLDRPVIQIPRMNRFVDASSNEIHPPKSIGQSVYGWIRLSMHRPMGG